MLSEIEISCEHAVKELLKNMLSDDIKCLTCKTALPKEIESTGLHDPDCLCNYYIECPKCGYQNNRAKLLKIWECTCGR